MKTNKLISILLAAVMMLSLGVPMSAFAEDNIVTGYLDGRTGKHSEYDFAYELNTDTGKMTLDGCGKMLYIYQLYENIYLPEKGMSEKVKSLQFNQGVTVIDSDPVSSYVNLEEVTIPASTKRILRYCFGNSTIKTINFGGTPEQWKQIQIDSNNDGIKSATIKYNVSIPKSRGFDTFNDSQYERQYIGENSYCVLDYYTGELKVYGKGRIHSFAQDGGYDDVRNIDDLYWISYGGEYCVFPLIKTVDFQSGITSIGSYVLSNTCAETVKIPKSLTGISENAFKNANVKDVYYAGNVADWNNIVIKSGNSTVQKATKHFASKVSATDLKYKLSCTNYVYDGNSHTPAVTVTDKYGRALKRNTDYTLKYDAGRTAFGKYKVYVQLKGQYSGHKTIYFSIGPKGTNISKINTSKGGFTAFWNTQKVQTNGYEVQYSTSSSFKSAKTVTLNKSANYAKKVTGLKSNKKYYVRVRTFKNIKVNGKVQKVYSSWSKAKSAVTK